ncbi:ABC transporter permease [Opitutales bacterium ASA1]|uniref:ABC transporter permease n=1 Tax=Congregicoccus parvus TaxID=3081749 RepID=UPI002B2C4221|nr:ABC transporter permease [Opitutales bacterium ASA1]
MSGFINWLSQVATVSMFAVRTIPDRKGAAVTTMVGIAGVTAVFVGMMSIATGLRETLTTKGREDVAYVTRAGADSEMTSILGREDVRLVGDTAGILIDGSGPVVSPELFVIINLPKRGTGSDVNVPFRGVERAAFEVREGLQMIEGRRFEPGRNEVVVGVGAARELDGLEVGSTIRLGRTSWDVVGVFSAEGAVAESEIWTDATVLQGAYQRGTSYQTIQAQLVSADAFQAFKDALTSNPQLEVDVVRQNEAGTGQQINVAAIAGGGIFIAGMMSLGALFGALNTMYSAVASRVREIATLRALGFGVGPVILSVLFESLVLAVAGGSFGALVAWLAFDGYTAATLNFQTFSQVAFAFSVTPPLLVAAIVMSAGIGLVGGILPAIRAARLPISAALRES